MGTGQRAVNPEEARCVPTEVAGQKRPADALPDGRNTSPGPPGSHVRVTRINTFVALLVAAILIAGCSETVSVRSGPSGAVVYLDGKPIGTTPLDYSLPRSEVGERHRVRVYMTTYALRRSSVRGARASPSGAGGSRSAGGRGAPKPAGATPERADIRRRASTA